VKKSKGRGTHKPDIFFLDLKMPKGDVVQNFSMSLPELDDSRDDFDGIL